MSTPDLPATERMPFAALVGIEALEGTADQVIANLRRDQTRCTVGGVMHGGALMALADTAGAHCAFLNLPAGSSGTTTIESKTNFLRAVREGNVRAVSRPLHAGRTVIVVDTELFDGNGRLVARVTQTQAVLWNVS